MEANTHQLSNELGDDYPTKIIYMAGSTFAVLCLGFCILGFIGFYFLRKSIRKKKAALLN